MIHLLSPSLTAGACCALLVGSSATQQLPTRRCSVDSARPPVQGNAVSWRSSISYDGRRVAFDSAATNLVGPDPLGHQDVFVRDVDTGTTRLVSVSRAGVLGDGDSFLPSISADGRWVAFVSDATNLLPPAAVTNGFQIFVKDMNTGAVALVSINNAGAQANGPCVGFGGDTGGPSISPDGRFVAFMSDATNLVPDRSGGFTGDTNGVSDVFWHDRDADNNGIFDEPFPGATETRRVSVSDSYGVEGNGPSGGYGLWISARGRFVAYASGASNLVPGDTNGSWDIFVSDMAFVVMTTRVSVDSSGAEHLGMSVRPSIGADLEGGNDGRYVTFTSAASLDLAVATAGDQVFLHDTWYRTTELISIDPAGMAGADMGCLHSMPSPDGRFVVFDSWGTNLVAGDGNAAQDVFRRDRRNPSHMVTTRVSLDTAGGDSDGPSLMPRISAAGNRYAFHSEATDLVAGDTNMVKDVFMVEDYLAATSCSAPYELVQLSWDQNDNNCAAISGNGRVVAWMGDVNGSNQLFASSDGGWQQLTTVAGGIPLSWLSLTEDGSKVLFFRPWSSGLVLSIARTDGSGITQLPLNITDLTYAALSADGSKIVYSTGYSSGRRVWIVNANGTGLLQLTNSTFTAAQPTISGDGSKVVFVRYSSSTGWDGDLWMVDADGSNLHSLTTTGRCADPGLDRTGSRVAFVRGRNAGFTDSDLCVLATAGGSVRFLTAGPDVERYPALSLDGQRIFCGAWKSTGTRAFFYVDFDGSNRFEVRDVADPNPFPPPGPYYNLTNDQVSVTSDGRVGAFVSGYSNGIFNPEQDREVFVAWTARVVRTTLVDPPLPYPDLGPGALGNNITRVFQLELLPLPGQPGVYHVAASVEFAGVPDVQITTGTWNTNLVPPMFVRTNHVDAENTLGADMDLTLSADLLVMVCRSGGYALRYSVRASANQPFPPSQAISPQELRSPKFCRIGGRETLALSGPDLRVADFDRTAYGTSRSPLANERLVARPRDWVGGRVVAAEPLRDSTGETRAFLMTSESLIFNSTSVGADLVTTIDGSGERRALAADLGFTHPTAIGGRAFFGHNYGVYYSMQNSPPIQLDFVASHSAEVPSTGGLLRIAVWAPPTLAGSPAYLLLGMRRGPCLQLPGLTGDLVLDPGSLLFLGPVAVSPEGLAEIVLPVPPLPAGFQVYTQPWVIDAQGGRNWLGSDSTLVVR